MAWPFEPGKSPFQIKGLVYRTFLGRVESTIGVPEFLRQMRNTKLRVFITQHFLASSWYDIAPLIDCSAVVARTRGCTVLELYVDHARAQAEEDLRGVYAYLLRALSPGAVAKALPRLAVRYFNWGGLEYREDGPRDVYVARIGCPEYIAPWYDRVTVEYVRVAMLKAGATALQIGTTVSPDGTSHGVPTCRIDYRIRW
jgi:hypothetical protein